MQDSIWIYTMLGLLSSLSYSLIYYQVKVLKSKE
jgi:hypothetical protein